MATSTTQVKKSDKVKSIDQALETLNEAAQESSQEIRSMMNKDYRKLKSLISDTAPQMKGALRDLSEASLDTAQQAKDQVVETTRQAAQSVDNSVHKNPWPYICGAAALGLLTGYLANRKSNS